MIVLPTVVMASRLRRRDDLGRQRATGALPRRRENRLRDGAYDQGEVWAWLLGPFALAHYRVHGDAEVARSFLRPLAAY